ncbi:MAG: hypothetical protein IJN25_08985 [Clostridia bacterium]|nr:hypothetical protein [Clostridia bacterium]
MQQIGWIVQIGAALGALAVIWRAFAAVIKLPKYLQDLHRHTFENYMAILRLTVMDPHMPLGERILAGQRYVEAGGNGEIKKFAVEELHINDKE